MRPKSRVESTFKIAYDYEDIFGELTYQSVHLEAPSKITHRHRDPEDPNKWVWGLGPHTLVCFRLSKLFEGENLKVFIVGNEQSVEALESIGLTATCHSGGYNVGWQDSHSQALTGHDVFIIPDNSEEGEKHTKEILTTLPKHAQRVRVLELPRSWKNLTVINITDYLATGAGLEQLQDLGRDACESDVWSGLTPVEYFENIEEEPEALSTVVEMFGGATTISSTSKHLGELMGASGDYYNRGGNLYELGHNRVENCPELHPLKPNQAVSRFEEVSMLHKWNSKGELNPCTATTSQADSIINSRPFLQALPRIEIITQCPVITMCSEELTEISAYNEEKAILAGGQGTKPCTLDMAVVMLTQLLTDFDFVSESDKARALASLITPALLFGGFLGNGRAPIDFGEAKESQSGKGFRNKLIATLYNDRVRTITQSSGSGVGSLEEAFNSVLISGKNFIAFDNVRGLMNSPRIESFCTEPIYIARCAYSPNVEVETSHVFLMLTGNQIDMTEDLANRCSIIRINKRPETYQWTKYNEGDLLDHVKANQPMYLGAIFEVVRAWVEAGQPRTDERRHSFEPWSQSLDWIVQNIFEMPPLLDGHEAIKTRMKSPMLGWARQVAVIAEREEKMDVWLRSNNINQLIADSTANVGEHEDDDRSLKDIGRRMGRVFKKSTEIVVDLGRTVESVEIDGMFVFRRKSIVADSSNNYPREYLFSKNPEGHVEKLEEDLFDGNV